MNRFLIHIKQAVLFLLLVHLHLGAKAQSVHSDFEYIQHAQPWLSSNNGAGLRFFNDNKYTNTALSFNKGDGEFINYYASDNQLDFNFSTRTYRQLNPRLTVFGEVDYDYFTAKHMGGSSLIDPYYNAFNLVEFADSTAGNKVKESYKVKGGFSHRLTQELSLGASGAYTTSSYFKSKDLRHTNDLLYLDLNTGLIYHPQNFRLGFSYNYQRRVESIVFESFGNTDQQYHTLIDYGAFMGIGENYSTIGTGFTLGTSAKPYFNTEHQVHLQLELFSTQDLRWFNELTYSRGHGGFGAKSTAEARFTEHASSTYNYQSVLSWQPAKHLHQLWLSGHYYYIENALNHFTETFDHTKGTVITYGVSQKVNNKERQAFHMAYKGFYAIDNKHPLWHLAVDMDYKKAYQRSVFYQNLSIRKQNIKQWKTQVSGYYNFFKPNKTYRLLAKLSYQSGTGYAFNDELFTEDQGQLIQINRYAYHEFEYLTAARIMAQLGLRYTHYLASGHYYSEINYQNTQAFNTLYIGSSYRLLSLSFGYVF